MKELEKFESLLESFAEKGVEEYCDLAANLYNKVLGKVIFTTLDEKAPIMVLRRKKIKDTISPQVRVRLIKKRESISRKYGRAVASAVIDPILKNDDIGEIDDIDDRVRNIINMNGVDAATGKKLPIKQSKDEHKTLKEADESTLTTLLNNLRKDVQDEYTAISGYDSHADIAEGLGYTDIAKVLRDIRDEEKVHVGELETLLKKYDAEFEESMKDGAEEVSEELSEATYDER